MERNVVLVTFNYRLQAFGFLSLDDPALEVPGWCEGLIILHKYFIMIL